MTPLIYLNDDDNRIIPSNFENGSFDAYITFTTNLDTDVNYVD